MLVTLIFLNILTLYQADGCALVKTNQAVLVGVYVGPNIRQQECVQAVEDMGAELIRHGF